MGSKVKEIFMPNKENLVPFKKGDARINRAGRPKNFDLLHEIAVRLCAELADLEDNPEGICQVEAIMREWLHSKNYQKQLTVIQYAYGKVPDQVEIHKKEPNTVIIEWGDNPYEDEDEEQEEEQEDEHHRLSHPEPEEDEDKEQDDENGIM